MRTGISPPGPGMARSLTFVPGAAAPKMKLVTALSGACRDCRAMTCASLFPAIEPWRRTSHAQACSRRSIRAIPYSVPGNRRRQQAAMTGTILPNAPALLVGFTGLAVSRDVEP